MSAASQPMTVVGMVWLAPRAGGRIGPIPMVAAYLEPDDREGIRLPAIDVVIAKVAYHTGVSVAMILGPRRSAAPMRARTAAAWVVRELLGATLEVIAAHLGGRDHTTIIAALRRAAALRSQDPAFIRLTNRVLRECAGEVAA